MENPATRGIVIFGGSSYKPGEPAFDAAEALGRAIAAKGWTVINGGYGGTMLAASRGARDAGGEVVGVGCSVFKSPLNEFISQTEMTGDIYARIRGLVDRGDAYVCMPGSTGTLVELALVWELLNKQMIPLRPLLCYGEFWRPVVDIFAQEGTQDSRINTLGVVEKRGDLIGFVNSPEEAVEALARSFAELGN